MVKDQGIIISEQKGMLRPADGYHEAMKRGGSRVEAVGKCMCTWTLAWRPRLSGAL